MVLETVDSCDGWEVKQRIKLTFLRNDGEEFDTDSNFTSYETKDGLGLRFSVRNVQNDEVEEELRGQADLEGLGGKGRASFTLPEAAQFRAAGRHPVPDHPSRAHHQARARRRQIGLLQVFDGARLDGAFQVNAVIGKPTRTDRGAAGARRRRPAAQPAVVERALCLLRRRRPGRAKPEYELALDLLGNGIARSMLLDYGDFAVDARLIQLQALPRPKC